MASGLHGSWSPWLVVLAVSEGTLPLPPPMENYPAAYISRAYVLYSETEGQVKLKDQTVDVV